MRRRRRVDAPGQGSGRKMAAAVTFCRLLGPRGATALSLPRGARCFGVRTSPTGEKVTHTGQVTAAARRAPEWAEPGSVSGFLLLFPVPRVLPMSPADPRTPFSPCSRQETSAGSPPWSVGRGRRELAAQCRVGPRSDGGRAVLLSLTLTDVRGNGSHGTEVSVFADYVVSSSASANSKMRRLLLVTAGRLPVGLNCRFCGPNLFNVCVM